MIVEGIVKCVNVKDYFFMLGIFLCIIMLFFISYIFVYIV